MNEMSNWLFHDHCQCETMLSTCQESVEREDWKAAKRVFAELVSHVKHHILMEEEILYPAYDHLMDTSRRATTALRREHEQIARLLRDLSAVLSTLDSEVFLESLLPLDEIMTKHHEKEEELFLPMAGHALLAEREEIMRKLEEFEKIKGARKRYF